MVKYTYCRKCKMTIGRHYMEMPRIEKYKPDFVSELKGACDAALGRKSFIELCYGKEYEISKLMSLELAKHIVNKYTQRKSGGNMTTIEMLKELVENGGMFEHDEPECVVLDFVKLTDEGVVWVSKESGGIEQIFEMDSTNLNNQWKPYVKPVDWTKVPIDTKVKCKAGGRWYGRHFAGIHCGMPSVWDSGCTSHSTHDDRIAWEWDEMKLAE